jgi:hypothetical protein
MGHEKVIFRKCSLFQETFSDKMRSFPVLEKKLGEFIAAKEVDPLQPFGGSDRTFTKDGPINKAKPGIRHAHLTKDISIFYILTGKNPTIIQLYAVFTHNESGTGNSPNIRQQQKIGALLAKQSFS